VVTDEVAGYFVTLLAVPYPELPDLVAAFFVFRVLDILKPWPARALARHGQADAEEQVELERIEQLEEALVVPHSAMQANRAIRAKDFVGDVEAAIDEGLDAGR